MKKIYEVCYDNGEWEEDYEECKKEFAALDKAMQFADTIYDESDDCYIKEKIVTEDGKKRVAETWERYIDDFTNQWYWEAHSKTLQDVKIK